MYTDPFATDSNLQFPTPPPWRKFQNAWGVDESTAIRVWECELQLGGHILILPNPATKQRTLNTYFDVGFVFAPYVPKQMITG